MSDPVDDGLVGVPDQLFFRIGEIGQIVGVEPHVLRYWEAEFRIRPQRSTSGQRMYRRKDLARFLRIKKLLHEEGYTIAGARKALAEPSPGDEKGSSSAGPIQDGRVREALDRIAQLRAHITQTRARVAKAGVPGVSGPSTT